MAHSNEGSREQHQPPGDLGHWDGLSLRTRVPVGLGESTLETLEQGDTVLVGGGDSYFPHHERRVDLQLIETRTFGSGVVYLRYRVAR